MKIVFMGTPDFSVPALEELAKVHQVAAVESIRIEYSCLSA